MKDLSQLTDQELLQLAEQTQQPTAQPQNNLSQLSDEELLQLAEQQSQQNEQKPFARRVVENVGQGLIGLPEGLGRAFVGAVQTGAEALGQKEFAQKIGQQIAKENLQQANDPTARKIGRFIGQIAPAIPVGSGAGLVMGGIKGGLASELISPTEAGTAEAKLQQTAVGGVLGGVTGGALKVLGATGKIIRNQFKKPEDIVASGIAPQEASKILDKLQQGEISTIADVSGDSVKGLTRSLAKMPQAKDIVTDALEGRSINAVKRVSQQLAKDVSSVDSYFGSLDDIAKARSEIASPIYKKAFEKGTTLDIKNNKALFDKIAPDIADARKKFRLDNNIKSNSIVVLDATKKTLDDKIGRAIRQGEKQEAKALLEIKNELVNKLDQLNPDYAKARQIFADYSSLENAQQRGLEALTKLQPEQIKKLTQSMTTSEKEAFRLGVRESLDRIVQKTPEGADPAKRIFGNSLIRDKIKASIGNDAKYSNFEKRMLEEIKSADTKFKVLGGSRTDFNLSADDNFLDTLAGGVDIARGNKAELFKTTIRAIKARANGISGKNAEQVAKILIDREQGINALQSIIRKEKSQAQIKVLTDFAKSLQPQVVGSQAVINQYQQ